MIAGSSILLVEDERAISEPLGELLTREGYNVTVAETGAGARARVADDPDLIILDWRLPDGQGIDLLQQWRRAGRTVPVIFLTARTELIDKVLGLEMGADDYVTKPFEPRELLARIKARLRAPTPAQAPARALKVGGVQLRLDTREVTFEGARVELARMEFGLLRLFMENPGRVFTRDEILTRVWGMDSYPTTRTVDTHVLQLRNKTRSDLFESIRGVGYRMVKDTPDNN